MTSYDTEKLIAFISERWNDKVCPMCNTGPWSVQDSVFQFTEFHVTGTVIGGPVIPIVPITCEHCGYTVAVNAIIAGAVARPSKESSESGQ